MGTPITESLHKRFPVLRLDHHLMIENPDIYVPIFIEAGATSVSVHYEVTRNLDHTLRTIRRHGALAGVAINPATCVQLLDDVLAIVDYVLVMSVNPGFGGQHIIGRSIEKVRALAHIRHERRLGFAIEMDGGIGPDNLASIIQAGADWIVSGSSVFCKGDSEASLRNMTRLAHEAALAKGRSSQ